MNNLPTQCPACQEKLKVRRLVCENCQTQIEGSYQLPPFVQLAEQDQRFIMDFLKTSGSLKDMAKLLALSYPTVRNRLDEIIEKIKSIEQNQSQNSQEHEK